MSSTEQIKSYIIYNPVYRQIIKYIKRQTGQRNFIVNTWNVCLYARDDILDMKLVWMRADSDDLIKFIDRVIHKSHTFFLWYKFPNILVNEDNYDRLKDFIAVNKLWKYIHKIETKPNMGIIRSAIKVITFHPRICPRNILTKFESPFNYSGSQPHLYIAEAYEWLRPEALKHFAIKIQYRYTHVVIYLVLDYYRTQRRKRNIRTLNLFDLCSLRLAMFDPRYYQFDQCEIPSLIHTELRHIIEREQKFDKNYIFDPTQYLIQNCVQTVPYSVGDYFLFYVSSYVDPLRTYSIIDINNDEAVIKLTSLPNCNKICNIVKLMDYVRLYTEDFYTNYLLDFIEKRPYLEMGIFGTLVPMSPNLIRKITGYPNVSGFEIDTSFPVVFDEIESIEFERFEDDLRISFCGHNENRALENCLTHFKTFLTFRPYRLLIKCPVSDYSIFNDIPAIEIQFLKHDLTAKMLSEIMKTELTETSYSWELTKLTNDPTIIGMLNEFPLNVRVQIVHDENTFELIFGFIEQQFRTHNVTEFDFKDSSSITIRCECEYSNTGFTQNIQLNDYTFQMNEFGSKIEMFNRSSGKIVDLHELLNVEKSEEMYFEFYQ